MPYKSGHRSSLAPWVSAETSNLMKRLATAKKLKRADRIQKISTLLDESADRDLAEYQATLAADRHTTRIFRHLRSLNKSSSVPITMIDGNQQVFGAKDQVSAFNRFFQSVYNSRNDGVLSCDFTCSTRMALDIVPTPAAVEYILSNLDPKRACGGDGIPNCLLKGLAKHLAPSVRKMI